MGLLETIAAKYSHDDALTTIALLALCFFAYRSAAVDLDHFGEGVLAIFGGHAARSMGNAKDPD